MLNFNQFRVFYHAAKHLNFTVAASELFITQPAVTAQVKSFEEASKRDSCDRLTEGLTSKNYAKILAGMGEYKEALELEKKAFSVLSMFLGKEHPWVKESDEELKNYTKLAVEKGNRSIESEKMKEQAAKAEAVAAHLAAEEERSKAKKTRKKKGKK